MTTEIQKREECDGPWNEIDRTFDIMERRFTESFGTLPFATLDAGLRSPRTDATDTGPSYKVVAEIPKEKLDIRVRGTAVEIRGESGTDTEEKD